MKTETFTSHSAEATRQIARDFAARLQPGALVTLSGELGAGKTTFVQGVAQTLGVAENATSPTFVLIIEHAGNLPLLHLDAYRLETQCFDAIRDAGVPDFLEREDAVKLVEWPERIADFLPVPKFQISIAPGENEDHRRIEITERP